MWSSHPPQLPNPLYFTGEEKLRLFLGSVASVGNTGFPKDLHALLLQVEIYYVSLKNLAMQTQDHDFFSSTTAGKVVFLPQGGGRERRREEGRLSSAVYFWKRAFFFVRGNGVVAGRRWGWGETEWTQEERGNCFFLGGSLWFSSFEHEEVEGNKTLFLEGLQAVFLPSLFLWGISCVGKDGRFRERIQSWQAEGVSRYVLSETSKEYQKRGY